MRVDGIPNVRTCVEPVKSGMKVESQNAWPSPEFDVASLTGYFDFLIRPGFQYRRFIRSRRLYHIWESFLRRMAGIGTLAETGKCPPPRRMNAEPEVVIVGGGVAGMSAALHASRAGAEVWLIEKENSLGGRLRFQTETVELPEVQTKQHGFSLAAKMADDVETLENIHVLKGSTAFAWYDEGILAVVGPDEFWELRPRSVIVSTGSYENPTVFENNDLPGVFLSGGLQRLMHGDGIRPGRRAVVITNDDNGYVIAQQLLDGGVSVAAIADNRPGKEVFACTEAKKISEAGIPVYTEHHIKSALGCRKVRGAVLRPIRPAKGHHHGPAVKVTCDTVCISAGRTPANELVFQRTYKGSYILESDYQAIRRPDMDQRMEVETGLYVAGEAGGGWGLRRAYVEGKIAGLSAALSLGHGGKDAEAEREGAEIALRNLSGYRDE